MKENGDHMQPSSNIFSE